MYQKTIGYFLLSTILVGCSTTVTPVDPNTLPPIVDKVSLTEPHVPTKNELLDLQPELVKKALVHFEITGQAPIIETTQIKQFPYGKITPQIDCSPLHTCDITLEAGEKITGVYPGDTARWLFESATSGENNYQEMHVIFKPKDFDLATNAIITTTKRTYYLNLNSKKSAVVKPIAFYYPDEFEEECEKFKKLALQEELTQQEANRKIFSNQKLDFNYKIESSFFDETPAWSPVRVFNDGAQVYIQMPPASKTIPLPALFVMGKDGQLALVNYRVKTPYYIVDQLFHKAVLKSGTGSGEQQITLVYQG